MSVSKSYRNETELQAVVSGFEDCTLPDAEFSHGAHLIVALSYLHVSGLTVPEAGRRMRAGLYRFLDHYGIERGKYNETITLFWIKLVRAFLDRSNTKRSLAALANEMIESYGDSKLIFHYYSKERLSSERARQEWIEPDLTPLDFGRA